MLFWSIAEAHCFLHWLLPHLRISPVLMAGTEGKVTLSPTVSEALALRPKGVVVAISRRESQAVHSSFIVAIVLHVLYQDMS